MRKVFSFILVGILYAVIINQPANAEWHVETVDSIGTVGQDSCISLDATGYPHISYSDATNNDLKYGSWNGTSWIIETVDSTGTVGSYTSLAIDTSGYPAVNPV